MGYLLYVILAALLYIHWRVAAGRGIDALLDAGKLHHQQVMRVIVKHPMGGDGRDVCRWMAEAEH
jgi:hypothetical protein